MNTRVSHSRFLIGLICCGLVFFANGGDTSVSAKGMLPAKTITVMTEDNVNMGNISANCTASTTPGSPPVSIGAMPLTQMTLAIQYSEGTDPVANVVIQIFVSWTGANGPGINLSSSTGTTDTVGKCYVTIKGSGQKLPDDTLVKVNAVHRGVTGNVDASGFATIHVFRHNSDYNNNPTPIISGVAKLTIPITFDDSNLTGLNSKYASLSSQARTDLTRGNITFTNQVGGAIKYDTVVDALHPTIYATTFPGMTPRVITYNEAALDDISDSSFVPFEKRHHTRPLADHELCHALFLDHNTAYERSIMWPTSYCYFVWGALTPRDDSDWSTLTGPNGY